MITKERAVNIWMNNGNVWFVDDTGRILCGRVLNMEGVKEPPNTHILHLDHIKTDPAAPTMVMWAATKQLVDVYETAEECRAGYINRQKYIMGCKIKTHEDLFQFMLSHNCKSDPVAHAVALEKHELFLHKI